MKISNNGAIYKAANGGKLGSISGRGRMDRRNVRQIFCPKTVYVCPLHHDFQNLFKGV